MPDKHLDDMRIKAIEAIQVFVAQNDALPEYIEPLERLIEALIDRRKTKKANRA